MPTPEYINIMSVRSLLLRATIPVLCFFATAAIADTPNDTHAQVHRASAKKIHKPHKMSPAGQTAYTGPVFKSEPVLAQPIPECSQQSAAELNKNYGMRGWIISPPNFADSVLQDYGCWRTNLAKLGFSFMAFSPTLIETNTLNHYVPSSNLQEYAGQRTTVASNIGGYLMYDLRQYGVPDGQLVIGGEYGGSTWIGFVPNIFTLAQLSYYQTALNKALEFDIGYLSFYYQFEGSQLGGNIYNVFGPASTITTLVGGGFNTNPTPAAIVKWNISNNVYDKAAISRSAATSAAGGLGPLLVDHYSNPSSFDFNNQPYVFGLHYPVERPLYTNEIGYKTDAAPGNYFTWVRFTSFYNSSDYNDLKEPGLQQVHNYAFLLFGDRQIWQAEPGSPATAYKGLYLGAEAAVTNPRASAITQDFQGRAYTFGLFGRPRDQISFVWEHQVFSHYLADPTDASGVCLAGITCVRHASNQYTLTYNANIVPGVYASLGIAYVDNPSAVWSPNGTKYGSAASPLLPQYNINHAVNFLASLFINL